MASQSGEALRSLAESILRGKPDSHEIALSCLDKGLSVEEILTKGVIAAWLEFAAWYDRDPDGALKGWMESYNATNRVLKALDPAIKVPENPPFSAAVVAVRGEGHVLMRDVISLLLRSRGVRVYSSRKGVVPEDLLEPISDPSLKWLVVSCTESDLNDQVIAIIKWAKQKRPDLRVIAGGPQAEKVGADMVANDPSELLREIGL
ncbi:MAG: hypothetical protein ACQXXL_04635 [Candidatus Methanosuratincola sp.]|jgi:methanogenic corrinoid protein MtbC1|nr:hypothetical protein [Candidatus Methanosuratincola sp.]